MHLFRENDFPVSILFCSWPSQNSYPTTSCVASLLVFVLLITMTRKTLSKGFCLCSSLWILVPFPDFYRTHLVTQLESHNRIILKIISNSVYILITPFLHCIYFSTLLSTSAVTHLFLFTHFTFLPMRSRTSWEVETQASFVFVCVKLYCAQKYFRYIAMKE